MQQTVTIAERFKGPPKSANGGYACGLMGRALAAANPGKAVTASLMVSPPLEKDLQLIITSDAALMDGDIQVGKAQCATLDLTVPDLPAPFELGIDPVDAPDAPGAFRPFATCYVCGKDRHAGDGLCIHSRQVIGHKGMVGAPWVLDKNLSDAEGLVDPIYLWAALDCPGYFACAAGEAALLGRLTVEILAPLKASGTATVIGWDLDTDKTGRKRQCGTAIYDQEGTLIAKAGGLWITVDAEKITG